ncbi:MAG TPA: hypothetical protein VLM85_09590 [Polyangiaceae bacterium]|nr:hypothetical protein [Polyangiaceae bacterium]
MRIATEVLDDAVLARIADAVCAAARVDQLRKFVEHNVHDVDVLAATWRALITGDHDVGRAYAMHLVERVELYDDRAVIVPKVTAAER